MAANTVPRVLASLSARCTTIKAAVEPATRQLQTRSWGGDLPVVAIRRYVTTKKDKRRRRTYATQDVATRISRPTSGTQERTNQASAPSCCSFRTRVSLGSRAARVGASFRPLFDNPGVPMNRAYSRPPITSSIFAASVCPSAAASWRYCTDLPMSCSTPRPLLCISARKYMACALPASAART